MTINFNDEVDVVLRPNGLKLWQDYYRGIGMAPPSWEVYGEPRKMALWEVAYIFGSGMCMGNDPPIELNMELHRTASELVCRT